MAHLQGSGCDPYVCLSYAMRFCSSKMEVFSVYNVCDNVLKGGCASRLSARAENTRLRNSSMGPHFPLGGPEA